MIKFTLQCDDGHSFDSWFKSSKAFEALRASGHLSCAVCGSTDVRKAVMAPRVTTARKKADKTPTEPQPPAPSQTMGTQPSAEQARMIEKLRREVEANSDYVGDSFADEARKMHLGDAPERSIYGEARPEDAKSLIEDGVPVMPLPFRPTRKSN